MIAIFLGWQCLIAELVGKVWSRVSKWMSLVVSDRGCGRKVSLRVVLLKVSYGALVAALDRRAGLEVGI